MFSEEANIAPGLCFLGLSCCFGLDLLLELFELFEEEFGGAALAVFVAVEGGEFADGARVGGFDCDRGFGIGFGKPARESLHVRNGGGLQKEDLVYAPIGIGELLDELAVVMVDGLEALHIVLDVSGVAFGFFGGNDQGLPG